MLVRDVESLDCERYIGVRAYRSRMIYECFIQKLGNPRISESAESRTNSFSIESVFKSQICEVIEANFRKAKITLLLLELQFIYVSRFVRIGNLLMYTRKFLLILL